MHTKHLKQHNSCSFSLSSQQKILTNHNHTNNVILQLGNIFTRVKAKRVIGREHVTELVTAPITINKEKN